MENKKIKNLEEMIIKHIKKDDKIIDTNITYLTAPGENYGSQIFKIDMKIQNKSGNVEHLNVVAKQIPESEFYQEVFNIQVTFNIETEFYKTIVPTMHKFQLKHSLQILDIFPKYYGARNNLNGVNNIVDKDAVLILENLKVNGYLNLDRTIGFDLPTSKLILKNLAKFHATTLALKLKEPESFAQNVKQFCICFQPQLKKIDLTLETNMLLEVLSERTIGKDISERFKISMNYMGALPVTFREPFATLVHRDAWVNNILVKFENGNAKDIKMVDFQLYSYDSLVTDLLFFLFTSVETSILKENFDHLIKYYYDMFINSLSDFKCNIGPFSNDKFEEEIVASIKTELGKMVFMYVFIVRGPKGGHMNKDNLQETPILTTKHLKDEDKDRVFWLLEEFNKKGWISY